MGIHTALLVVQSKTWSSFFRKHHRTQAQVKCTTQHKIYVEELVFPAELCAIHIDSLVSRHKHKRLHQKCQWIPALLDWTYSRWQRLEEVLNLEHGDKGDEWCFQDGEENSWRCGKETQVGLVWSRERRWLPWGQEHTHFSTSHS